jgi:hypothetical protein
MLNDPVASWIAIAIGDLVSLPVVRIAHIIYQVSAITACPHKVSPSLVSFASSLSDNGHTKWYWRMLPATLCPDCLSKDHRDLNIPLTYSLIMNQPNSHPHIVRMWWR